jgi:hypothetical protein
MRAETTEERRSRPQVIPTPGISSGATSCAPSAPLLSPPVPTLLNVVMVSAPFFWHQGEDGTGRRYDWEVVLSTWISGGYYLIEPFEVSGSMDRRLPKRMWSISACLSNTYPDEDYLDWVQVPADRDREIRQRLGLDVHGLAELKKEVARLFEDGSLGWPNVFLDTQTARAFSARWLATVSDLRLLGISLASEHVERFIGDTAPGEGEGESGVRRAVRGGGSPVGGTTIGFEVLGMEQGGHVHSFVCNGLEADFMDELDLPLNEFGLIADPEEALAAAAWVNREEVGAEPVPWYEWRVDEYGLNRGAA